MNEIKYILELANIKDTEYKNTLAITSLIELLIEKGVISQSEIAKKSYEIKIKTAQ
ncbi:hypothetical protein [Thermoanaerobacterium sp. RBIITD]|uniref:hypothetical protein n=1 Tax=Thermoanaerobacterium sp. RBIITD TaxID=1550240 RepID=UPI000BC07723|nr:hypothetical protein [Thermoanaerobacterium sp. RBIITD]SNX53806.1 hypothetical protein SAMN05660242_1396 [Thermoanaerobacterium sp. RBIITD]